MVAFRSLFTVSAVLFVGSVSAISVVSPGLQSRQLYGINPYDIPKACTVICTDVLNIVLCEDTNCICNNDRAAAIQACYSCALVNTDKNTQETYQSVANQYISGCKTEGVIINSITISKDNVNGTSVNGTSVNGTSVNGTSVNGTNVNGTNVNGTNTNGTNANGAGANAGKGNGALGRAPTFALLGLSAAALIFA